MSSPSREWWSASELADAGLPDLPGTKRKVNAMADRDGWAKQPGKARRRRGQGGGIEYHWTVLPIRARMALTRRSDDAPAPRAAREEAWAALEGVTDAARATAQSRLSAIEEVELLEAAGLTRSLAVTEVAARLDVAPKSIWNWLSATSGVARADRLPYLVDGRAIRKPARRRQALDPEFLSLVKSDWLRLSQPSLTSCYDRAARVWSAERQGSAVPPLHQVRRWIKANVSKPTQVYCRKGSEALRRFYPPQVRDKSAMVPLECVQGGYHKFDVFVDWPGEAQPVRPQMMIWSDVYSGKLLAWRLSVTANSHTVQLVTGDMIERFGIPQAALIDNGREFAAKAMTGGTPTRYRFKITDEDIPGLLPLMGVEIHWSTPYSGQSKPIERAFRDLCDRVAKHPAFDGAYTGNRPDAKPEDYGSRAVPLDVFREVLADEIEHHNARPGRRSEVAFGRSFNEVFTEAYAKAQIRRATDEQRRLWLLRAEGVRAASGNGAVALFGSQYWSEWMYRVAGEKVVARFDPDDLLSGIEVYDLAGRWLGRAECMKPGQFLNVEDARDHARRRGAWMRAQRDLAKAERHLSASEIAARLRSAGGAPDDSLPEAQVVQLATPHKSAPKPRRRGPSTDEIEANERIEAQVMRLSERQPAAPEAEDDPEARFARARAMENDARPLTPEQQAWLAEYQQSAEYRGFSTLRRNSKRRLTCPARTIPPTWSRARPILSAGSGS